MTTRLPLVLAADADNSVTELIRRTLRRQGMHVVTADNGERALRLAEQQRPDLVLLSTSLPGTPGLEVLRRLRARGPLPAILLTAARSTARPGALRPDETLAKPFTAELLARRVAEAMGRAPAPSATRLTAGSFEIDLQARVLLRDGREIALTRTEWGLLVYLASHPGRTLSSGDILGEVWGPEYREDLQFLRVWVSRLRSKLGSDPANPLIRTARGVGYVFDPSSTPPAPERRRTTRTVTAR
jgi:DNA-binding response OmpR family regulator